ncbi:hypothetical protein [Psychroflexus salis]|uniref:Uncharacterized protein n=1 Tax=Psychroflexus salis TaxID=1526574 RepID=A0A916ZUX0_9FLAO|nr:hypothetical protein [Psychroflexus salis]GGE15319.1 hypothetical protein GCM10010831_15830 [Psychroflexus salis]
MSNIKFVFRKHFWNRSNKINMSPKISGVRKEAHRDVFQNKITKELFEIGDVEKLRYKRNNMLKIFFETYSDTSRYSLIEFGLPYIVSVEMSPIMSKLRKRCKAKNIKLLGYVWMYDVGEENFGSHFHLVIAVKKINKRKYPKCFKMSFKKKKMHGDFVRNSEALKNYLIGKEIFERGYKKKVYGKSIKFKELKK